MTMCKRTISKALTWALSLVVLVAGPAAAQVTLFQPRDTAVDLSRYRNMEMCRAAAYRIEERMRTWDFLETGVWRDTIPVDPRIALDTIGLHPAARETARKCIERAAIPDRIAPDDHWRHRFYYRLLWDAGLQERALELLRERMATFDLETDSAVIAAIDTLKLYAKGLAPPAWEINKIIEEEYVPRIQDVPTRVDAYLDLAVSYLGADSVKSYGYVAQLLQLVQSLDEQEYDRLRRETKFKRLFRGKQNEIADFLYAYALGATGDKPGLDSLRSSTDAYVRHKKELWSIINREPPEAYPEPIGERAPEIEADFWLGCDSPCGPRPTPGRVSLVVFFNSGHPPAETCTTHVGAVTCAQWGPTLRRLERLFPELETTVVRKTRGAYSYKTQTPEMEAELARQYLNQFGIRAALAVTETPHWYLPEPDGRRINQLTANDKNYSFGGRWNAVQQIERFIWGVLVDRDGKIVEIKEIGARYEFELTQVIKTLFERERSST